MSSSKACRTGSTAPSKRRPRTISLELRRRRSASADGKRREVTRGAQDRDTETHRPVGVEGGGQPEPCFGEGKACRERKAAPEAAGNALRGGRRADHQREYQQHADDLRTFRDRQRNDREECG